MVSASHELAAVIETKPLQRRFGEIAMSRFVEEPVEAVHGRREMTLSPQSFKNVWPLMR